VHATDVARESRISRVKTSTVLRTGSTRGHVQRLSFRFSTTATAAAYDENVTVDESEGGGQHPTEIGNCQQCKRNAYDGVQHRHDHSG